MSYQNLLTNGKELILATVNEDNTPQANIVISLGFFEKQILVGACQMDRTLKNLKRTGNVVVIIKGNGEYYRIRGTAKVASSGPALHEAIKYGKEPFPEEAILVRIDEVFDLDQGKIVNIIN
ncbi:MAG: pyridoxamine 5'-phosphate oxidase family protein [bacterium]